jgi:xylan 1,4-beta-xylosidase
MKSHTTELFYARSTRWALSGALLGAIALTAACGDEMTPMGTGSAPGSGGAVASGGGAPVGGSGGGSAGGSVGSGGVAAGGVPTSGGVPAIGGQLPFGGVPETVECMGAFPSEAKVDAPHQVTVESATSWGDLPHFWNTYGVGRMGLYLQEDREWGKLLREHTVDAVQNLGLKSLRMHGLFHDDMGIYSEDAEGNPIYDFTKSDDVFDFFDQNGIEQIVELAPMPSALASDPTKTVFDWKMGISPPKDYAKWQELVREFVKHSVDRYGVEKVSKWYFEVWNEPECCNGKFWTGPAGTPATSAGTPARLTEYFKLYDYTAAGVRAALPNGRMGGPVSSQAQELTKNSMAGKLFLDHVMTGTNAALPGQPPVLDFFSFHTWSFVSGAVDGYFEGLDLLDSYGLNNMPIAITEFGPTWEFGLTDEPQEMTQGSTFVAQVYSDVSRRVVQEGRRFPIAHAWWVLSDVFDEGKYREEDPFIGCMGLTSREGIHKPAYNVYKFLGQMGDRQLAFTAEGQGDVGGMAARDTSGGIQVLLYHGSDPGLGPGSVERKYYTVVGAQDIAVSIDGLDPDVAYDVTEYRVDATTGNAYDIWLTKGRPAMSAMTEGDWKDLRDNMDAKPVAAGQALCGESFKKTYSLSSPGVVFLTLKPAVKQP